MQILIICSCNACNPVEGSCVNAEVINGEVSENVGCAFGMLQKSFGDFAKDFV